MHRWTRLIVSLKSSLFEFKRGRLPKWAEHMEHKAGSGLDRVTPALMSYSVASVLCNVLSNL